MAKNHTGIYTGRKRIPVYPLLVYPVNIFILYTIKMPWSMMEIYKMECFKPRSRCCLLASTCLDLRECVYECVHDLQFGFHLEIKKKMGMIESVRYTRGLAKDEPPTAWDPVCENPRDVDVIRWRYPRLTKCLPVCWFVACLFGAAGCWLQCNVELMPSVSQCQTDSTGITITR